MDKNSFSFSNSMQINRKINIYVFENGILLFEQQIIKLNVNNIVVYYLFSLWLNVMQLLIRMLAI